MGMSVSGDTLAENEVVTINVVEGQPDDVTQQVGFKRIFRKSFLILFSVTYSIWYCYYNNQNNLGHNLGQNFGNNLGHDLEIGCHTTQIWYLISLSQIVEQLEDGTVQILDQPVEAVDRKVQYVTEDQIVLEQQ